MKFTFSEVSSFSKAEESPGFLLWRASTLWRRSIESVLKPLDLTHPQFVILASIGWFARNGSSTSQIHIARHAGLDPNTTSQIIRGLLAKKFIERSYVQDERSKSPMLTDLGAEVLSKALPAVEQADREFFKEINLNCENAFQALQKLAGF